MSTPKSNLPPGSVFLVKALLFGLGVALLVASGMNGWWVFWLVVVAAAVAFGMWATKNDGRRGSSPE